MPTMMITAVFEGAATGALTPGRPIPDLPIEVGGPGRDSLTARTDASGSCTVEVPDTGGWTVAATDQRDEGALLGLLRIDVAGPLALVSLPVRLRAG